MQKKIVFFVILTVIFCFSGLCTLPLWAADSNDESSGVIADEIFTALEQNSEVLVAIALRPPNAQPKALIDYNHDIATLQQDVIQALDPRLYTSPSFSLSTRTRHAD